MAPSFFNVLCLMMLSFISGYISVYLFQMFVDPHLMNDLFSCNDLTIIDLYKWNCYITFPSVYITSLIYLLLDGYYENNNTLHLKRIYNPKRKPLYKIPWKLYQKACIRTFITVYQYILFHTFIGIQFWKWRGICNETYTFWSNHESFTIGLFINIFYVIIYIIMYGIIADIIFYSTHRLLHESSFLYKYHKLHHEWVDTFGIASSASSIVENFIVGIPTLTFTPMILGMPIGFAYILMSIAGISTICSHSGYKSGIISFGGIPHDYHHHYQKCEYGTGGICDLLFKTRIQDVFPDIFNQIEKAQQNAK